MGTGLTYTLLILTTLRSVPHIGIDFGSRYAGTTAICYEIERELQVVIA